MTTTSTTASTATSTTTSTLASTTTSTGRPVPPTPQPDSHDDREVTLSVGLAVLGVFVTYLPITAVSAALSSIGRATGASTSGLQWVSDAYVIPMAASVLSAGVFGDIHGRRRVFTLGMVLTLLGAAGAALASLAEPTRALHLLWIGQAVSGLGAGMLLPTTLALISHAVPEVHRRGRYIGLWATGLMLGLALGPLVSGLILRHGSWGWVFIPTAGLALLAGLVATAFLPESTAPVRRTLDWRGQLAATATIAASIFSTIEGGARGWTSLASVVGFVVAGFSLLLFLMVESDRESPLMDLSLFRIPTFTAAGLAAAATLFSVVGTSFVLSLFLGYSRGWTPLHIGLQLIFVAGVGVLVNPVVGALVHRTNALLTLAAGLVLAAVGVLLIASLDASTGFADLAWRLAVLGVATAVMMTSVSTIAVNSVPWHVAGMAAATNTALRQAGGALGPAVLGVVFTAHSRGGTDPAAGVHAAMVVNAAVLGVVAAVCLVVAATIAARARRA